MRVTRPQLTTAPPPPEEIREWLLAGWDSPENDVQHLEKINIVDKDGSTRTISFGDDGRRRDELDQWIKARAEWVEAELPARAAMRVFDRLYGLHVRLEREAERFDLVVGDGILSWDQDDGSIYHPLLLQRVQLVFDAKQPEFRIVDAAFGSELYTGLFQSLSAVDPRLLRSRREEFEAGGYHPLDEEVSGLLSGLANQLSAQGSFLGKLRPQTAAVNPAIGRAPVLFLRSRTKGFGTAIERVIETIEDRDDFSTALRQIVGCERVSNDDRTDQDRGSERRGLPAKDILFGREANPEQLRIARAVDRHGAVLVQGPPGTGKSHTIANLIGHLLAHGKTVLVTSHTTKALRVLRGHLVEELRPLCVSVLENDLDSRSQLEEAVQAISARLSESDADSLAHEADRLQQQRAQLIDELERLQAEVLTARASEYREIVFGGTSIAPSDAARFVASGAGKLDWIPGPVALGEPCPLSQEDTCELYASNATTIPDDDNYVDNALPETADIPTPHEFAQTCEQAISESQLGQLERRYWSRETSFSSSDIQHLSSLIHDIRMAADDFAALEDWKRVAIDAGRRGQQPQESWFRLLTGIEETVELATAAEQDLVSASPQVADTPPWESQLAVADEIQRHFFRGGRLSWWGTRSHWAESLNAWLVQGQQPKESEQIAAIQRLLRVKLARRALLHLWDNLMAVNGAPSSADLGDKPERVARQFSVMIEMSVGWWHSRWLPLENRLGKMGFNWKQLLGEQPPNLSRFGELERIVGTASTKLLDNLERTCTYLTSLRAKKQIADYGKGLEQFGRPEVQDLRRAIEKRDPSLYETAYTDCIAALTRQAVARRRKDLLFRLERRITAASAVAPAWARAIRERHQLHCLTIPPSDVAMAWKWRQLADELKRRAEIDVEEVSRRIEALQCQLKATTNQLIDRKAWSGQVRRTRLKQQQALMGWLGIIKRIGNGFGRRVPQLRQEAQRKMEECREAVPVWVMPLSRLVENFDFSAARFDVVIIDEASQCDVMALIALAIARQVVVVGDDKQVSPVAVGQKLDTVENLIRLHLDGIPNAVLYDGRMSVYDLAKQSFPGLICLLEHFRCVPDIIQFSNHLCYEGRIKPLRERASSLLHPHVVPYRVDGTRGSGKVNDEEATIVASLVVAASEHPAYANQTIGVISLIGDDQAMSIERLLLQHMPPAEYERRRIICGNSAQFQGDERHVIFLSMVDSPTGGPLRMSNRSEMQQRYNVAVSRARNQMWLVYSLNHETDLQPGDLRRRLIEHALDPEAITREIDRSQSRTESPFEQEVHDRLVRRRYQPRCQWPIGYYRVDLAFPDDQVAVECDGDRYHSIEQLPEDMERQAILERIGWRFVRIRGSVFFREPDETIERVIAKLEEFGVKPEGVRASTNSFVSMDDGQGPSYEVIRRAAELRAKWKSSKPELGSPEAENDATSSDTVGENESSKPEMEAAEFESADQSRGACMMTRFEFHRHRQSLGFHDPTENTRQFWQEIKKCLSLGKTINPDTLQEYISLFGSGE
jgi:very-short-patch-repair endonuclease